MGNEACRRCGGEAADPALNGGRHSHTETKVHMREGKRREKQNIVDRGPKSKYQGRRTKVKMSGREGKGQNVRGVGLLQVLLFAHKRDSVERKQVRRFVHVRASVRVFVFVCNFVFV